MFVWYIKNKQHSPVPLSSDSEAWPSETSETSTLSGFSAATRSPVDSHPSVSASSPISLSPSHSHSVLDNDATSFAVCSGTIRSPVDSHPSASASSPNSISPHSHSVFDNGATSLAVCSDSTPHFPVPHECSTASVFPTSCVQDTILFRPTLVRSVPPSL